MFHRLKIFFVITNQARDHCRSILMPCAHNIKPGNSISNFVPNISHIKPSTNFITPFPHLWPYDRHYSISIDITTICEKRQVRNKLLLLYDNYETYIPGQFHILYFSHIEIKRMCRKIKCDKDENL